MNYARSDWLDVMESLTTTGRCRAGYTRLVVWTLACDEAWRKILGEALCLHIDPTARQATHLGYSTQANEAFNRKLSKNMPKNIIFSRNHPGRLASAVHMYNHGRLKSVTAKLKAAGVPLSRYGGCKTLEEHDRHAARRRSAQRSQAYKHTRRRTRARYAKLWYDRKCGGKSNNQPDYSKGHLDPVKPSV